MVRLEEFADDEEVGALDRALGEDLGQRLADLLLVAVAGGAVEDEDDADGEAVPAKAAEIVGWREEGRGAGKVARGLLGSNFC